MFFHNTLRKYTLALLETFGNLKVEYTVNTNNNIETLYKKIPIKYSNREKINLLDEVDEQNLLSGNYNFLPRSKLTLTDLVRNIERQTIKFVKLGTNNFGEFLFNAVSYDFNYEIVIMCRGMNEASMIAEQVTTKFNPTYNLLINEIPNQDVPTTVPIQLLAIEIEPQDYDELSTDIINIHVSISLKGNFYNPLDKQDKIKHLKMFLNLWYTSEQNDFNRAVQFDYDVVQELPTDLKIHDLTKDGEFGKIVPVIESLSSLDSITVHDKLKITCIFNDYDNKLDELTFSWSCTGSTTIEDNGYYIYLTGDASEIVEVQCMITDIHNNTSNLMTKQITII